VARNDRKFSIREQDGIRRTFRLLDYVTIDDVMENAQKAMAAEVKGRITYPEGLFPRTLKDDLVLVRIVAGV